MYYTGTIVYSSFPSDIKILTLSSCCSSRYVLLRNSKLIQFIFNSFHWHVQKATPFSGASSILLCYVLFPATLLHQLFFHPLSPHLAIYFLACLLILLFQNSYIIPFWEFCFLPFSVHAQTNVIYLALLSLL